ncbi:MAG TPA: secondary thiamine-phosphate synthase enzyme YjbQ, partial [Steroidobacteraceae bacterium]|nr:secondary thiamine-phosphate synthase enzyme YjbQ [Steroidobacteraceae bacterium]
SMQTVAPSATCRHTTLRIDTDQPTQFIDLTADLEAFVAASGIQSGLLNVQSLHTTAAIVVNEHEPLLLTDMAGLLERLAPVDAVYRHDNITLRTVNCVLGEPPNGHSHCRALLLGSTAALNVVDGVLQLGRWQRVFLVELDGPRTRDVSLLVLGDGR